jgi:hypothetical protein
METRETRDNIDSLKRKTSKLFFRLRRIEDKIDKNNKLLEDLLDFFEQEKRRREIITGQ